jgi:hypothetical protein
LVIVGVGIGEKRSGDTTTTLFTHSGNAATDGLADNYGKDTHLLGG